MGKTALVLSAGGSFGAYQVGVWKELEKFFRPDIVIGTSIGAVLGYFGKWIDILGVRFVEIWASIPVLYTIMMHPPKNAPNPMFYVGLLCAAAGAGMVLYFRPQN